MSLIKSWNFFINSHKMFLNEMKAASELNSRVITLLPTIIFMTGAFILIFKIFHRRTHRLTPTRIRFYRELGFHWTYFYLIRIWFLVIKIFKWGSTILTRYIENSNLSKHFYYQVGVDITLLLLLLLCSFIPSGIIILKQYMRETIPDFLMWIGQDPWLRSEIGLSGHYLDRPPNFSLPRRTEYAYRSKRSMSTEETVQRQDVLRNCKSMVTVKCVKSVDDMLY